MESTYPVGGERLTESYGTKLTAVQAADVDARLLRTGLSRAEALRHELVNKATFADLLETLAARIIAMSMLQETFMFQISQQLDVEGGPPMTVEATKKLIADTHRRAAKEADGFLTLGAR